MISEKLLAALLAQPQQKTQAPQAGRLALAMAKRSRDARYASLAALPAYGESKHADRLSGASAGVPYGQGDAFQSDAYQNDAYQV